MLEAFVALVPVLDHWEVREIGGREVIDALVAPGHRARGGTASPALAAALAAWPGAHYWADADRGHLVLIRPLAAGRRERWGLHTLLFLLTVLCTLGAGAALLGRWDPWVTVSPGSATAWPVVGAFLGALADGLRFFVTAAAGGWRAMLAGWTFAVPLLAILLVHELGHYFTARRYAVDASPPFFLPLPPTLSPIGSLGAFLRLRSPVLDRRQLLDIGAAGPLAGFVVAFGVLVWGYATSRVPAYAGAAWHDLHGPYVLLAGQVLPLGDSLLTLALRHLVAPGAPALHLSAPAFAGWVGAFITGLNLLPLSQLDGGHVLYAVLGPRQRTVALLAVVGLLLLAQLNWSWYVWVVLALLIGGGRWSHPSVVVPDRPVTGARRWLGWLCALVFALTFVPVPFRI
ncbi:MAG TPA: site-2 protease family protein [Gemmatimonadales bacterium]|nr:site-2 protease family protein [Gemmatimonadales bacterium]